MRLRKLALVGASIGMLLGLSALTAGPASAKGAKTPSIKLSNGKPVSKGVDCKLTGVNTGCSIDIKGKNWSAADGEVGAAECTSVAALSETYCDVSNAQTATPSSNGSWKIPDITIVVNNSGDPGVCRPNTTCYIGVGDVDTLGKTESASASFTTS
jgi:hypothetical protein